MKELLIFIVYVLLAFGVSEMFVFFDGPFGIIDKFRRSVTKISRSLGALFGCMFCFSTWVGLALSALNYWLVPIPFTPFNMVFQDYHVWWLILPFDMFLTCGTTWLLYNLEEMLERTGRLGEDITENEE